jgi:hypothetical protein
VASRDLGLVFVEVLSLRGLKKVITTGTGGDLNKIIFAGRVLCWRFASKISPTCHRSNNGVSGGDEQPS